MKKLLLLIFPAVLIVACKKDNTNPVDTTITTNNYSTLIIGKWHINADTIVQYQNGKVQFSNNTGGVNFQTDYQQFNSDGTCIQSFNGNTATLNYSIKDKDVILKQVGGDETGHIKTLTSSKFVMLFDDTTIDGNTTTRTTEVIYMSK